MGGLVLFGLLGWKEAIELDITTVLGVGEYQGWYSGRKVCL